MKHRHYADIESIALVTQPMRFLALDFLDDIGETTFEQLSEIVDECFIKIREIDLVVIHSDRDRAPQRSVSRVCEEIFRVHEMLKQARSALNCENLSESYEISNEALHALNRVQNEIKALVDCDE